MRFLINPHQVTHTHTHTHTHTYIYIYIYIYIPWLNSHFLIFEALRWHSEDSSARTNSPTQRPPPDNTQHSKRTDIYAPGGNRTHNRSKRAAPDPRFRSRCRWGRPPGDVKVKNKGEWDGGTDGLCRISRGNEHCIRLLLGLFCITVTYTFKGTCPAPLSFPTTWFLVLSQVFTIVTMNIVVFCDVSLPGYTESCRRTQKSWSEFTF